MEERERLMSSTQLNADVDTSSSSSSSSSSCEARLFVTARLPRLLATLESLLQRADELLSTEQHEVLQLKSGTAQPLGGELHSELESAALDVAAQIELRSGGAFELLASMQRASKLSCRHAVKGQLPRLSSVLLSIRAAVANVHVAQQSLRVDSCTGVLALLDLVAENVQAARRFQTRSAAVSTTLQATMERLAHFDVTPAPQGGAVFDVFVDGFTVELLAGFVVLPPPSTSTLSRTGSATSPWRTLRSRLRRDGADKTVAWRECCRVTAESRTLRRVHANLAECAALLSRARTNVLALSS
jgi:hypothetical protein